LSEDYEFTQDWFTHHSENWRQLLAKNPPSRILEIGSYEGRATCFIIDRCAADREIEVHCVDTWQGGVEHNPSQMGDVERRFDSNLAKARARAAHNVDLHKHRALSSEALVQLLADGRRESFDLIYVDGSHQAPDVLADAVLAFMLAKVGGIIAFDDYLWSKDRPGEQDFYQLPKPAVDAFVNIYQRKLRVMQAPLYQLYVRKVAS